MTKSAATGTGEPTPVALVGPVPTPVVVTDNGEAARKRLEKELLGIRAKLRWTHISEATKDMLRAREVEIQGALKG